MSDLNTRMPPGSDVTQRTDEQPAFSAGLLELILQPSKLVAAWKQVRANKGAAGIDGMTIDDFYAPVVSNPWHAWASRERASRKATTRIRKMAEHKRKGDAYRTITMRVTNQAVDYLSKQPQAPFGLKTKPGSQPLPSLSSNLLNKVSPLTASGLFNTWIRCRLRDTYPCMLA